jgi:hypothetical protein
MRRPNTAHTSRPWRIRELTRDFRLEDVWRILRRDPRVTADWVCASFQRHQQQVIHIHSGRKR